MKLGIDPGKFKIGIALVQNSELLFSAIVPKAEENVLCDAIEKRNFDLIKQWIIEKNTKEEITKINKLTILIGNGTSSGDLQSKIDKIKNVDVEIVDEYGTTLEGRKIYWELHPPKGLWKLIPTSLRTPPRNIDDLAAYAIAIKN